MADFGILQPLQSAAPIRSSMGQSIQASAPPAQTKGISDLGAGLAQVQQMETEKAKLGLLQNEDARAQALQPGVLQAQANANTAAGDIHLKAQQEQAANQYEIQVRDEAGKKYVEGKNQGGPLGGMKAAADVYLAKGQVKTGMDMYQNAQKIEQDMADNNSKNLLNTSTLVHGSIADAVPSIPPTPATKDPQTGAIIPAQPGHPGITALQNYTNRFKTIKASDPNAPDPSQFKSNEDFLQNYAQPVMEAALPLHEKLQADYTAQRNSDLGKAQSIVQTNLRSLQESIRINGADSPETKLAANAYDQATQDASRVASGSTLTGRVIGAYTNAGAPSSKDIIKGATTAKPPVASESPASMAVPAGRITVKNAQGQIGHIPAGQLQDALKSGYTQVK